MVVRVAQRVSRNDKRPESCQVVVACDDLSIIQACAQHGIRAVLTRTDHTSGSDRLAEACDLLGLADDHIVVNVQGDEPLIDPTLVQAVAALLVADSEVSISTAAHPIELLEDYLSPNVVKVVLDAKSRALYFSRAAIPLARDTTASAWWADLSSVAAAAAPLRHIGVYGYRAGFLRAFPRLSVAPLERVEALEQLRAMWHGYRIAVHVTATAPGPGVDTVQDLEQVRRLFRP